MAGVNVEIPKKVYTCGLCEIILGDLEDEETWSHECFANYSEIVFDVNSLYLYPKCEDGSIVRRSAINGAEQIVIESPLPTQEPCPVENLEELIITEVSARELLWNQKLSITKRDRQTVQQLWKQVANATNGECSVDEVKKKWKNLRDRYMKIISLEKLPSGSGSKPSRRKWQHYELLSFLRDTSLEKETVSNMMSREEDTSNDDTEIQSVDVVEVNGAIDASKRMKRKRKSTEREEDLMKQIAEALQTPRPPLPTPPVLDEVDNFTSMIACQLRELSSVRRRAIMLKIHELLRAELLRNDNSATTII
ncbi:uncharacterized protein LOC114946582 isoform X2 [Nylanderia fulva]|uniref:uncharacterized protein LOC114928543 isoform X2 n=2 Tax=Nylanderia fulva TaxID=613905 RepID=UPI0010FB1E7F|nr:uncharacterized protein LOC114928543 isoform X2 [Nylanderia fulva]XP_029166410.1 uncharacterized protein LOC114937152 isoform X2 [Nylanderia fulva]XP_029167092.1 uncharacterized protein LOC114937676 isoform X2 [Nylanderia fulva]XP_029172250.1 uncharacterized protein LOC114941421 isoform X2 [Nylanderia fulva]XP_029173804.1 uncharacterized protein LOC114942578 isoform X2 [Nylanderia fulva]XP_029174011.1 uncharacterized protein LOC114942747 isoform X2 [Nylanderia fulva]XP_029178099.1 uncharac